MLRVKAKPVVVPRYGRYWKTVEVSSRPILLKNSTSGRLTRAREIYDRIERPRIDDRHLGRGSMTPGTVLSHFVEEFFNRISQ